ncbi:MAG: hypothetical protein EAZ32_08845 [Cytophagia bacterium]|nr:MAG: hypothetical protein EAZ38_09840 [Cytophagales bacterium]TAG39793.1 MAG: hypothetical protein EAZ32_08845 [Cytophagia bacterium]TAG74402.1 MAG: hypothetical protein EAZ26_02110 [Runella slithyformis]TAG81436.1 MAG: hypothetical protein EAZ22_07295 [Cytophagales bacterium]
MKLNLFYALCLVGCTSLAAMSQEPDDLLKILDETQKPATNYTQATFKSTRIINGHSVETVAKKHLDFRISHRFGALNSGAYNLFGLDLAYMRMGFEYGLTDRLMVGLGRSGFEKTFDYFAKYKLLRQSEGAKNVPVSVTLLATGATTTMRSTAFNTFFNNLERQTYCFQVLVARKLSERFSAQLSPTLLHRNKTESVLEDNSLASLGLGGRVKLTRRTTFNIDYFLTPQKWGSNAVRDPRYTNCLSMGFDIETGGHVFQLHFSNSQGMIEKQFIGTTQGSWSKGDIFYGFNISRTFSFDKNAKKLYK